MFNFGIPLNEYDKIYTGLDIEHMGLKTFSNAPQRYHDFINQHGKNNGNGSGQFKGWLPKFTLGWGRNTTNHAYWATKGYIANVNGEITIPSVSKLDFYKLETNGKYFIPVGKSGAALMLGGKLDTPTVIVKLKSYHSLKIIMVADLDLYVALKAEH